jgi:hypothetical protein
VAPATVDVAGTADTHGHSVVPDPAGPPDSPDVLGTPIVGVAPATVDVAGTADTHGHSVVPDPAGYSDVLEIPVTRRPSDNSAVSAMQAVGEPSANKKKAVVEPRDHVKLRRSLAAEMRDAVWFLSEHGRARVQLVEILDEAVGEWLAKQKVEQNEGRDFPHRGGLR